MECGRDECDEGIGAYRCEHHAQAKRWLEQEYQRFTEWREEWKKGRRTNSE